MSNQPLILVVDDEPQILRALRTILSANRYRVITASRGEEGLALVATQDPDIVILDLGLPDMNGLQVCSQLREWSQVPIIVLSVRENEKDKVAALDHGADDYLTKPFGIEELLARIRVALRHAEQKGKETQSIITTGSLSIDLTRRLVTKNGEVIRLTVTEYKLLAYLAAHADRVLTHTSILNNVWGSTDIERVEYLRVYISQLRRKIEDNPDDPDYLVTESGVGYRFLTGK